MGPDDDQASSRGQGCQCGGHTNDHEWGWGFVLYGIALSLRDVRIRHGALSEGLEVLRVPRKSWHSSIAQNGRLPDTTLIKFTTP